MHDVNRSFQGFTPQRFAPADPSKSYQNDLVEGDVNRSSIDQYQTPPRIDNPINSARAQSEENKFGMRRHLPVKTKESKDGLV